MVEHSGSAARRAHPIVGVLDAADAMFEHAAEVDVETLSDDDLPDVLARCHALAAQQAEMFLRLVAEADTRDLGRRLGASSTTAWLRELLRLRPGAAKASVDLAHRLTPPAPVEDYAASPSAGPRVGVGRIMPATHAKLAAGEVSVDHATVIAKTMAQLPTDLSAEDAARAEADLAAFATEHDPATLQRLATHLLHVLYTESPEGREERARRKRRLRIVDMGDGTARITGLLSGEDAAIVRTALDPLAAPQPGADGERDDRAPDQRLADALVELARRHLGSDTLPTNHGHSTQLLLLADLATLLRDTAAAGTGTCTEEAETSNASTFDSTSHAADGTRHAAGNDTMSKAVQHEHDQYEHNQHEHDQYEDSQHEDADTTTPGDDDARSADMAGHQSSRTADNRADATATGAAGRPPRRWLQDTWAKKFGVAPAELAWNGPVSTETARRLTCDAQITAVLLDPNGVPLRVGRSERTVTPGIWTALVARDRGCTFPGCTRPPAWCDAHHITHWADGGPTDVDNLVLLCGHHHRTIHHGGWDVRVGPNGHPEFIPPCWVDPDRMPRRNTQPRHTHQPPPGHRHERDARHRRQIQRRAGEGDQRPPPDR